MMGNEVSEWAEQWAERNPFTNKYVEEEVAFYGVNSYDKGGVTLGMDTLVGVLDDYLNRAFAIGDLTSPILRIDGRIWMSLTRMECQSQHLPIQFAHGDVGTVGLGMGHFTLRVMENPHVTSVTVFEEDPRIITFFKEHFRKRPGFEKVTIVEGDARKTCKGYTFDFLYVDPYPTALGDEVISDIDLFLGQNHLYNHAESYHFWGLERVLVDAVLLERCDLADLAWPIQTFIARWYEEPIEGHEDHTLGQMWRPIVGPEYIWEVLSRLDIPVKRPEKTAQALGKRSYDLHFPWGE